MAAVWMQAMTLPSRCPGTWAWTRVRSTMVNRVAADMVVSPKLADMQAVQAQGTSMDSIRQMLSGLQEMLAGMRNGESMGTICIPVYVGGTLLDEVVVNAQARQNLRSGGR